MASYLRQNFLKTCCVSEIETIPTVIDRMDQYITFLTGFGSGVCLGMSLLAFKKYVGISPIAKEAAESKAASAAKGEEEVDRFPTKHKYRLDLVVRSDLPMTKGKVAARCGQAAVIAFEQVIMNDQETMAFWNSIGQPQIALKADSLDEIKRLEEKARQIGVIVSMVSDDGRTQTLDGVTVLGIGPAPQDVVNQITGHLKLL